MRLENDFLDTLSKIPRSGIWALINENDKMFYLSQSSNMIEGIAKLVSEVREQIHHIKALVFDFPKLRLEVLEVMDEPTTRLLHSSYWNNKFQDAGYEPYRNLNPVQYKLVIETEKLFPNALKQFAFVRLRTRNRMEYTVGVFETMVDATRFVKTCYPDPEDITGIAIASNEITQSFYKDPNRMDECFL